MSLVAGRRFRDAGLFPRHGAGGRVRRAPGPALQDRFPPERLVGIGPEKTRFFRGGLSAELDRVGMDGLSKEGVVGAGLQTALYRGAGPTEADFHRVRGSARAFLPVSDRHVVAVRAVSEINRPDSGRGVPFFHLAELGGDPGGRAYANQRFRAPDMAAFTAEWRYEVWRELLDACASRASSSATRGRSPGAWTRSPPPTGDRRSGPACGW